MKQITLVGLCLGVIAYLLQPITVMASQPGLIITEVMAGSTDNAKQEFIELYNDSAEPIDFRAGDWFVQIASSSSTNWDDPYRTITIDGYLMPGNYYLIGTISQGQIYPFDCDLTFSSAISAKTGHIRLVKQTESGLFQIDSLEWGDKAEQAIGQDFLLIDGLVAGNSVNRKLDSLELYVSDNPSPITTTSTQPELPIYEVESSETSKVVYIPPELPIQITELLPNPVNPFSDDQDEYIELYNPNTQKISLADYKLRIGKTKTKDYKLSEDYAVEAKSYLAIYNSKLSFSLSNSGSAVVLVDPNGVLVGNSIEYSNAKDGLVWQLIDDNWQWGSLSTPGLANQSDEQLNGVDQANKSEAKPDQSELGELNSEDQPVYIHNAVLVGVAAVALLYGVYEYRNDLAVKFHKLRTNRNAWPKVWCKFKGWRSNRANQRFGWWQNRFRTWSGKRCR